MPKRLVIVDLSSFIFRAYYAIRPLTSPNGTPVNAVYGVLSMLLKIIADFKPTHVFIAQDSKEGSFRKKVYPEYKMNRGAPPESLIPQFTLIEKLIELMDFSFKSINDYEADDIIGTAITIWKDTFDEIFIASGDKDLMQFIGKNVFMLDSKNEKIYGEKEVQEKMGVRPDQIGDYLSLIGDASDNIPGVRGIGPKGAIKLLSQYQTLENCIKNIHSLEEKKLKLNLETNLENAFLSKELITIVTNLDLNVDEKKLLFKLNPSAEFIAFLNDLGFKSQVKKMLELSAQTSPAEIPTTVPNELREMPSLNATVIDIKSDEELNSILEKLTKVKEVGVISVYSSTNIIEAEIKNLYLCFGENLVYSIDLQGRFALRINDVLNHLWSSKGLEVVGCGLKKDFSYLKLKGISLRSQFFDIEQSHYLIDVSSNHELTFIAKKYLDLDLEAMDQMNCFKDDDEKHVVIMAHKCWSSIKLKEILKEKMQELKLGNIFYEMDNLLIPILAEMEINGIFIDSFYFKELESIFLKELQEYEQQIKQLCLEPVNLRSPKQVASLLFEKLSLPIIKKNKTGPSTDVEVLEELAARNLSEIPGLILRFRGLEKLLSTYVSVLPSLVNPKTHKIHTSFNQAVTATGRLSSDKPNLQNIPIRTINGKKVRKGFISNQLNDYFLLSADYSQIELRILAHLSQDKIMVESFNHNLDIHQQTASEIFNLPLELVGSEHRSKAKAVNFGLMYGQSSFGLSKTLRINQAEAKTYILKYFERFKNVKNYLDTLKEKCSETGYAETLFGRKRFLPDINSKNRTIKSLAERMAVNTPIQGTAADIIKLAMIGIAQTLKGQGLESKLLLQVHDELILEVPAKELEVTQNIVVQAMEGAVTLDIPLKVDVRFGKNWMDLE